LIKQGGIPLDFEQVKEYVDHPDLAIIVIMDNGPFEAAGLAYDRKEFVAFTSDSRPKTYVALPKQLAYKLTGYRK
jgi:hypothetical protein